MTKFKYEDTVIIIPARFGSTRLKGKSLADINGIPMVVRVLNIAKNLNLCDVFVATESQKVIEVISNYKGNAILTDENLQSGTDRVYQALNKLEKKYKYIINLQGDMPDIDGKIIEQIIEKLHKKDDVDILTAVYKIIDTSWNEKPQCVKAVICFNENENYHKCLYFSRACIPTGNGDKFAHLGIYGYTFNSLSKFVSIQPSKLEKSEKLEQLRALENNLKINAIIVNSFPTSVDVIEDLEEARKKIK